jgi:hypothetical protein
MCSPHPTIRKRDLRRSKGSFRRTRNSLNERYATDATAGALRFDVVAYVDGRVPVRSPLDPPVSRPLTVKISFRWLIRLAKLVRGLGLDVTRGQKMQNTRDQIGPRSLWHELRPERRLKCARAMAIREIPARRQRFFSRSKNGNYYDGRMAINTVKPTS